MRIRQFHVDAFTARPFTGNPAAVCPLEKWLPDATMQSIAAENNLAETAIFVPGKRGYDLRCFTPTVEVDLCGHATLASAFVLFEHLNFQGQAVHFQTQSGELIVRKDGPRLEMDFPSRPATACMPHTDLVRALGSEPSEILAARDYLCVFNSESDVRKLAPNFERLSGIDRFAVIATAPGDDCDFVSRFFAPAQGVNEDPVTGSAHCTLAPYWSKRLGKTSLFGRQISARGGEIWCEDRGDRILIAGNAVLFSEGDIIV